MLVVWTKASLVPRLSLLRRGESLGTRLGEPWNEAKQKLYLEEVCH